MDALTRHQRMLGAAALWQPGTDHAGIATQMVVERLLDAEGLRRADMSREAFVERVWAWKEQSGGTITRQMRRLGASADWSRERFTLDPGLSAAVLEAFVRLHEEGLIYRGERLVNWDPVLRTALSDLEVLSEEEAGHLWYLRYPLSDGTGSRRGRDHAAGNHARRRRRGGTPRRRALPPSRRPQRAAADRRPHHSHHRRRLRRSGLRYRLREDHAGARLQRLRRRPAALAATDQHLHAGCAAQRAGATRICAVWIDSRRASASSRN